MADIQVPQTNPNAPQVVNPFPLVDSYLNRQQRQQEIFNGAVGGLGTAYNEIRQQKIARQMDALKAISDLYGAGGRRAVQSYGPTVNQVAGAQLIAPDQSQQPSSVPMSGVGGGTGNQGTQGTASPSVLSDPAIQNHAQSIGWDLNHPAYTAGTPNVMGQTPTWNAPQPSQEDIQDMQSGGNYGKNLAMTYKDLGDIGLQPLTAKTKQQEIYNTQPLTSDQVSVLNDPKATADDLNAAFPRGVPPSVSQSVASRSMERGKGSADTQTKYNTPEAKIQNAAMKLNDLYKAFQAVPTGQKGPAVGIATSKAGSMAGGAAPDLVTYNKLREAAAVSLAIARNPENPRPSPQDIQDELKNLPSVGDDPRVATNLFNSTANDLKGFHNINTQGAQSAAGAFGGHIQEAKLPDMNFNPTKKTPPPTLKTFSQYARSRAGHIIGSNDGKTWFDASTGKKL